MNRHLYGEAYGITLQTLQRHFDFERFIAIDGFSTVDDHFPLRRHSPGTRHLTRSHRTRLLRNRAMTDMGPWEWPFDGAVAEVLDSQVHTMLSSPLESLPILWTFKHSYYTGKIMDDELYLANLHHITGPRVTTAQFTLALNSIGLKVCRHIFCYSPHSSDFRNCEALRPIIAVPPRLPPWRRKGLSTAIKKWVRADIVSQIMRSPFRQAKERSIGTSSSRLIIGLAAAVAQTTLSGGALTTSHHAECAISIIKT